MVNTPATSFHCHNRWPTNGQRIVGEVLQRIVIQLRVAGHMWGTVSANDVQLGQYHPVTGTDLCHKWDHLPDGFAVERCVGHLRTDITDMTLQADHVKQRMLQCPLDHVRGCPVDRCDSDLNGLGSTRTGGQDSELCFTIHDDSSDPGVGRL
jgi:hypothetical protein